MGEIKKQSINNTILSYFGALLGFLLIYLQPKLITSSDIGLLRLLFSFSSMVAMFMPLGIGSITLRFFPKIRNESNGHNGFFALMLLFASLGASLVAIFLYLNKAFFTGYYENAREFPFYFNETLFFSYILSLIAIYSLYTSSLFKTSFTVFLTDVFTRLCQLVLIVLYAYGHIDKNTLVLLYIGIFAVQLFLMIAYLVWIKAVSFKINWAFYKTLNKKQILLFGLLMTLTAFASLGIKFIDQLMIGHFLSERYVGIYATSVMICVIMEIPFNSLDRIAQPKIAYAWNSNDREEIGKIYKLSTMYMFFVGGVLFCLLWSGIDLFYLYIPEEYSLGKMAFYLMSFSSLINLLTGVNTSVIAYSPKYFVVSLLLFLLIVVSFLTNNYFIEWYGITGAALAALVSLSIYNVLKYVYILVRFKMQPFTIHTLYVFLCILLCTGFILFLSVFVNPFVKAFLGGAFTVTVFSVVNIRFKMVEEVNKLFRRFRIIR